MTDSPRTVAAGPVFPLERWEPLVPEFEFCLGPGNWDIIDGTLYQEDGTTYMVFVHEWTQIIDGTMAYMPLSKDLTRRSAEPTTIFRASEAAWAKEMNSIGEATFGLKMPGWVTDGPQLFRTRTGKLGMLWSSWGEHRYAQGVAYSTSGSIKGPWVQETDAFKGDNSGQYLRFLESHKSALADTHPDFILLQLGTNDVRLDGDLTETPAFERNMRAIVAVFRGFSNRRGDESALLLATIPPVPASAGFPG